MQASEPTDPARLTALEPARHALAAVLMAILERHGGNEVDAILSQASLIRGAFERLQDAPETSRSNLQRACYAYATEMIR